MTSVDTIVNGGSSAGSYQTPEFNGWTLSKFDPDETEDISAIVIKMNNVLEGNRFRIGGIAVGQIYEPEFHADLAVTQRRIMDGVKNRQTKGGNTYSIINHIKPPDWWNGNPFQLGIGNDVVFTEKNSRIGRRSWDVRFSQLQDRFYTDGVPNGVFPANEMLSNWAADAVNGGYSSEDITAPENSDTGAFNYNLETDNSLYSTVYHNTLLGTLPFLFSPSQDNSPGNFAICRFDKPGFQVQQKSYKKFNVKMRINESW